MYQTGGSAATGLALTGITGSVWMGLAAFALVAAGTALWRIVPVIRHRQR